MNTSEWSEDFNNGEHKQNERGNGGREGEMNG